MSDDRPHSARAQDEPVWRYKLRSSKLATIIIVAVTLVVVLVAAAVFNGHNGIDETDQGKAEPSNVPSQPVVGEQAPDFTVTTLDGTTFRLSDHRGEPVWVIFQATWCSGCRSEARDIQEAYEAAKDSGLNVLAVYSGEDKDAVTAFANRMGLTFVQASDDTTTLSGDWGVMGLPSHFFIAPDGKLQAAYQGVLSRSQMDEYLAAIR